MIEPIYQLAGLRKLGALDAKDSRNYTMDVLPVIRKDRDLETIDNRSYYGTNQGTTTKCTCFTATRVAMSVVSLYYQEKVTFDPDEVVALMGVHYQEGKGAYLFQAMKAVAKFGLHDETGRHWKFEKYIEVPPAQFDEALEKGFCLATGSFIATAMCDSQWILNDASLSNSRGGHAWVIYGKDFLGSQKVFLGDNSWGKWGIVKHGKKTGGFYVLPSQVKDLFTTFTLVGPSLA